MMKIIIGLGNPGFRYRATRHNVGFMALDEIAAFMGIKLKKRMFDSLCGEGRFEGGDIMLAKPLTFMNLSGRAVRGMLKASEAAIKDVLVISDDADLDFGRIKLKAKGSSAGHNGLRSIIEQMGTEEFPRLRVGIGGGDPARRILSDYVLSSFKKSERLELGEILERCRECALSWVRDGIETAMSRFNS